MDFEKVKRFYGWSLKYSFENALSETVDWCEKYLQEQNGL